MFSDPGGPLMSRGLYWRPPTGWKRVGNFTLRDTLEKRFGSEASVTMDHYDYIRALADAEVEGADTLLSALEQHGQIDFRIE